MLEPRDVRNLNAAPPGVAFVAMAAPFSAIVLAGGRSTRMGREKALLEVEAVPMWRRQQELLRQAGAAEVFLSVRPSQDWSRRVSGFSAILHDSVSQGGPMIGITAGLERSATPWLAVLAIDLPAMTAEWFRRLQALTALGIGAVGKHEGKFEPLAAIYPREIMTRLWESVARAEYSLQPLLAAAVAAGEMRVHEISPTELAWFENWNAPRAAPR
jgi:molybdopterin-guanine dinucleotide biosynthesis protein A